MLLLSGVLQADGLEGSAGAGSVLVEDLEVLSMDRYATILSRSGRQHQAGSTGWIINGRGIQASR